VSKQSGMWGAVVLLRGCFSLLSGSRFSDYGVDAMKPVPNRVTQAPEQGKFNAPRSKSASGSMTGSEALSYQGTYICPICRHGHISNLTLMDAFACNFCRHIFTANLNNQSVQVVDSSQPMSWRWNGRSWKASYHDDPSLTIVIWLVSAVLVVLPASIVWVMSYLFPPLPGSTGAWFPQVWLGCTLGVHFLMVGWLLAEHYQLPLYITNRIRLRSWMGRR
jgi:hypothetical protein